MEEIYETGDLFAELSKRQVVRRPVTNFKDGEWAIGRLKFLVDHLSRIGLSTTEAAAKAGFTRQTVYHWLDKDDVKLSSLEQLLGKCGYSIHFSLARESGDALTTEGAFKSDAKRLDFLDRAFRKFGIPRKETAEKLGIGYSALYCWFKADDIFISYVYDIAAMYGLRLIISLDERSS